MIEVTTPIGVFLVNDKRDDVADALTEALGEAQTIDLREGADADERTS